MGELLTPTLMLSRRLGVSWANIEKARELSRQTLAQLREVFADSDSDDTSIVVCGSLAREEFTAGSDIDWTFVLDGISDPNHHALFIDARRKIEAFAPKGIGREGTFGAMISSHDLIHNIGGEDDTNRNLTRRLLLLLESTPVGRREAHERIVTNILARYLLEDRSFWRGSTQGHYIPHFLLNDLARLWRTMAVDFAYKLRTRSSEGWAIRNIKLRMSRKLLYVAGLLNCFYVHMLLGDAESRESVFSEKHQRPMIVDIVRSEFCDTPLDIVAGFFLQREELDSIASGLFGAYDEFLGIISNSRAHLETLTEASGDTDKVYQHARKVSHRFRDSLLELFFDNKTGLGELTRLYGVF